MKELEQKLGDFDKGGVSIAMGGDLFIRPATISQLDQLLKLEKVTNGTIAVSSSLPKSYTNQRVVIRQVPTGDTD